MGPRLMPAVTQCLAIALLIVAPATVSAQDPPPPLPPPTAAPPPASASASPAEPLRLPLSEEDLLQRRNAIFTMESVLVSAVRLAATSTQTEIEKLRPDLKVTLFSPVLPSAWGNHLDDYGVLFQVLIPTYQPSVVSILNMLEGAPRQQIDPAQRASARSPQVPVNPDAVYVEMVRRFLVGAMLDHSKGLELRPYEWLTVAARAADGVAGPVSEPSVLILRVKGSDLGEFLAGRLSIDEMRRRVHVRGFSGRR